MEVGGWGRGSFQIQPQSTTWKWPHYVSGGSCGIGRQGGTNYRLQLDTVQNINALQERPYLHQRWWCTVGSVTALRHTDRLCNQTVGVAVVVVAVVVVVVGILKCFPLLQCARPNLRTCILSKPCKHYVFNIERLRYDRSHPARSNEHLHPWPTATYCEGRCDRIRQ